MSTTHLVDRRGSFRETDVILPAKRSFPRSELQTRAHILKVVSLLVLKC